MYPPDMLKDLRYAAHMIVKERWYSAVAVLALSLGIGLNATVFTLVNAVLIKGLPYKDADRLYMVGSQHKDGSRRSVSLPDYEDWKAQQKSFSSMGGFSGGGVNVSDDRSAPQQARSSSVTAGGFAVIGQPTLLGREFTPDDEKPGAEAVTLIGFAMWKSRYAEDRSVIGKTLRIDGKTTTIVGIMPEGMQFPQNTEIWTPVVPNDERRKRDSRFLQVYGRLGDGVTREQAQTELNGIS